MMEIIKYRIGDVLHEFTVNGDNLVHVKTGKVLTKVNRFEKNPFSCKLLTPRVAGVAALNRLVANNQPAALNQILS